MARHNREGHGTDQQGFAHTVNYQPDWLRMVKVTRVLDSGRQSTKTLFRNPARRAEAVPAGKVRTRITSPEQGVDFEIVLGDPRLRVGRVQVQFSIPRAGGGTEDVVYTLEDGLPLPDEG